MKTIGEILKLSSAFLQERKIDRFKRIAEELLAHVLGCKRIHLYLQFDKPLIDQELQALRALLKKCGRGEPLEYVIGEIEFFGCKIKIDKRALIPRPETEILIDLAIKRMKQGVLWDLCTGSGCIGIALKKVLPALSVTLSDLSPDALALAASNAQLNGVEVELLQGDLLTPFQGRKADYIVCNPPYISDDAFDHLDPSVRDFEPKLALAAGQKGTEFYERLMRELPPFLNPNAQVFLEIGAEQGGALKRIFGDKGELLSDWAGHPRFFFLESKVFVPYPVP